MSLDLCRVVLVETHYPGNLGATARVMRNMGLRDLALVNPRADRLDARARQLSTHGESILHEARVVASLDEAAGDCTLVVGTSARTGGLYRQQSVAAPDEIMPHLVAALARGQATALVFGPEPTGLGNDLVTRCHYLIEIPADETYPALNLAQAVAVCLYELRKAWLRRQPAAADGSEPPAPFEAQEHAFRQLQAALEEIHFLYGDKAGPLMHAVRHLIGRAGPTHQEIKLLLGLARQIRWYVANHS